MAAAPIDLSSGLVPKPIDLSAGLVPKADAPAEKSLWQKAKDNFNSATQGAKPGDGTVKGFIEDVGAGGGDVLRAIANPSDTVSKMFANPDPMVQYFAGDRDASLAAAKNAPNLPRTIGQMGTGAIVGEAAGRIVAPVVSAAKTIVGKGALLGKTPADAYESALKPSTALSPEDRAAVVQTGLKNEIPISKGGLGKLSDRIDALNNAISDEIAKDPTRPIDPNAVSTRAADASARFAKQVNARPDLDAIEASKQQFLDEQGQKPGVPAQPTGILDAQGNPIMRPAQPPTPAPPMNAADAQAMKQGTYQVLKGKFGEQGSASVEAQKALARGLKEEIATRFPEIGSLNADESRLLDLQPVLERAVNRISNHQAIGIGTPVAGAAAKALTGSGSAGVVATVLKSVLDNPSVKSRLAIAISKSSNIPISQAMQKVATYSLALGASAAASQAYSTGDSPNPPTTPQP